MTDDDAYAAESYAADVYAAAGARRSDPPGPSALACAILGSAAIRYVDGSGLAGDAALVGDTIRVRRRLSPERETFAIAHELGEWAARREQRADAEQFADHIAACIVAPHPAFTRAARALDEDLTALGAAFVASESLVALRIGETEGAPMALVTPLRVRIRGSAWSWHDERTVRALAERGADGVRCVRLRDDPRRVAVFVAD